MSRSPRLPDMAAGDSLLSLMPNVETWMPVRRPRLEARWFVEGGIPRGIRPVARSLQRVDAYHVPSLTPDLSIKRRGDSTRLECKSRSRAEHVTIAGVDGFAERWQKWRPRRGHDHELDGPWAPVAKQIWSLGGVEIGIVTVGGSPWWTIALPLDWQRPERSPIVARWLGRVGDVGTPAGYAAWLLDRLNEQSGAA